MSQFIYLLNAMEDAAQASNPALEEYGIKRRKVLEYVEKLEASVRPEAALIAAVHDMLAALEMIQAQVSKHALRRHSGDFLDDPATVAAFSAMRAALKKARGERGPQSHEQEGQ